MGLSLVLAAVVTLALAAPAVSRADAAFTWAAQATGPASSGAEDVAMLPDGSSVTVGYLRGTATIGGVSYSSNGATSTDLLIVKANADGSIAWVRHAGSTTSDWAYAVAPLPDGSTLVGGTYSADFTLGSTLLTHTGNGSLDAYVGKLDPDGTWAWVRSIKGPGLDSVRDIAIRPSGSAVLTGATTGTSTFGQMTSNGTSSDLMVADLTADGTFTRVTRSNGGAGALGRAITVLADGSVAVSGAVTAGASFGATTPTVAGDNDVLVAKVTESGFAWAVAGGGTGYEIATGIAERQDGSIAVAGYVTGVGTFGTISVTAPGNGTTADAIVAELRPDGVFSSVSHYGSTAFDMMLDLVVLPDGSTVMTGAFRDAITFGDTTLTNSGRFDVFVVRMLVDGSIASVLQGVGDGSDTPTRLAVAPNGTALVTGTFDTAVRFGAAQLSGGASSSLFTASMRLWPEPVEPAAAPAAPVGSASPARARLSTRLRAARSWVTAGKPTSVRLTVRNDGTAAAEGVVACLRVPVGLAIAGQGTARRSTCVRVGTVAAGRSATRTVRVRMTGTRVGDVSIRGLARIGDGAATPAVPVTLSMIVRRPAPTVTG